MSAHSRHVSNIRARPNSKSSSSSSISDNNTLTATGTRGPPSRPESSSAHFSNVSHEHDNEIISPSPSQGTVLPPSLRPRSASPIAPTWPHTINAEDPNPSISNPQDNNDRSTNNSPRKNTRRRYTPRQIPHSAFRSPPSLFASSPPVSPPPRTKPPEMDVAQFISLTQQLNGQMDGLVDYQFGGGRWER